MKQKPGIATRAVLLVVSLLSGHSVDLVGAYGAEAVQGIHAVAAAQHTDAGKLSSCI